MKGVRALVALVAVLTAVCLGVLPTLRPAHGQSAQARNVILLIGDGMGFSEVTLARLATVGPGGRLNMDRMPHLTAMTTHSLDAIVTDSSAGGTAIASGSKTNNHLIGIAPDLSPTSTFERGMNL